MRPFFRSFNSGPQRKRQQANGSGSRTETALHRTRLRSLDHKNFAKEILCKAPRQPAPLLGFCILRALHSAQRFAALCKSHRAASY
ncbi:hypothetical protein WQ75_23135 [Escherichia coli]|nr:hypothetical protein ECO9450_05361 [Escherichia coli O103:H2 str. CVM9450]KLG82268.1 hypothetical protein WQ77_25280 [Escherichia coli]KNF89576.1 hypothetical protein WQ75_23135 [Escherichia coli]KNF95841.1 hypothetical protein WR14_10305 [Escherichia coli]KPO59766.1 hypothetical protein ACU79_07255 [Escherichia coli]